MDKLLDRIHSEGIVLKEEAVQGSLSSIIRTRFRADVYLTDMGLYIIKNPPSKNHFVFSNRSLTNLSNVSNSHIHFLSFCSQSCGHSLYDVLRKMKIQQS
jgi:hypothetical protein